MRAGWGGLESEAGATSCGSAISLLRSRSVMRLGFAGTGRAGEMTGMRAAGTASKGTRAGIFSIGGGGVFVHFLAVPFFAPRGGGEACDVGGGGGVYVPRGGGVRGARGGGVHQLAITSAA